MAYFRILGRERDVQGVEDKREAGTCEGTEKSENGEKGRNRFALYTIPTLGHMTIYLYLFGRLHILISPSRDLPALEECSRRF